MKNKKPTPALEEQAGGRGRQRQPIPDKPDPTIRTKNSGSVKK